MSADIATKRRSANEQTALQVAEPAGAAAGVAYVMSIVLSSPSVDPSTLAPQVHIQPLICKASTRQNVAEVKQRPRRAQLTILTAFIKLHCVLYLLTAAMLACRERY